MQRKPVILCAGLIVMIAIGLWAAWRVWRQQERMAAMIAGVPSIPALNRWPSGLVTQLQVATAAAGRTDRTTGSLTRLAVLYQANGFSREAQQVLETLHRLEPANARWPYLLADLCQRSGDATGAERALRSTVKLDPAYAPAWLLLGNLLTERESLPAAEECYLQAALLAPGDLRARFALIAFQAFHGKQPDRRRELAELVKAHPAVRPLHELMAQMHAAAGDPVNAAVERRRAELAERYVDNSDPWLAELVPDCFDPNRLSLLAYKLTREWRLEEAERVLKQAIPLAPTETALRDSLCHVYELLGRLPEARAVLETAVVACPDDHKMPLQLARVLRLEHRPDEAVRVLRRALHRWPAHPALLAALGKAWREANKTDEALPVLREAVRLDPTLVEAQYDLGYCLLARGQKAEARAAVEKTLVLRPDYPEALLFLSSLAIEAGDAAAAEPHVTRLYALRPDEPDTRMLFAVLQLLKGGAADEAGDPVQAGKIYRQGLAAAPDFMPLLREAGLLAARLGRWPEATAALEHCLRLAPGDPGAYLLLGKTLRSAGREADARRTFEQGLTVAEKAGDRARVADLKQSLGR